jgi:hypothetical protein
MMGHSKRLFAAQIIICVTAVALAGAPITSIAASACSQQYNLSTQLIETLAIYHQSGGVNARELWKKARNLHDAVSFLDTPAQCDMASTTRFLLADSVYESLAISNGARVAGPNDLKVTISGLVRWIDTSIDPAVYQPDFVQFSDMAQSGFNEDFFRSIVRRLVEIYRSDHYAMTQFSDGDMTGLRYWVPDLTSF